MPITVAGAAGTAVILLVILVGLGTWRRRRREHSGSQGAA
jgi:MYXO-CTERM domain-containing protein